MLDENKTDYLINALQAGKVSLFLGSGFNEGSLTNKGQSIADNQTLIKKLWEFNGYSGEPNQEDTLTFVYQSTLTKNPNKSELSNLLRENLEVNSYPEWMKILPLFFWRKIYSTNIDNLVEKIYSDSSSSRVNSQILNPVNGQTDDYCERDTTFHKLIKVSLHGTLGSAPDKITFGIFQYAARSNEKYDPWYYDFVYEYSNFPFIFIGSKLDEPIFWQYLEARKEKHGNQERRPRSFIITPDISPARKYILSKYNIHHIPKKAKDFFLWLNELFPEKPNRMDVIKKSEPDLILIAKALAQNVSRKTIKSLKSFLDEFQNVKPVKPDPAHRKTFFHSGAVPTWQDIAHKLDAKRDITDEIYDNIFSIKEDNKPKYIFVHGTAGSGKSTVAKRLAWNLSSNQFQVYFNESSHIPIFSLIKESVEYIGGHPIFIIDDVHKNIQSNKDFIKKLNDMNFQASVIAFSRSSSVDNLIVSLENSVELKEYSLKDLSLSEIKNILSVLDETGMLGKLQGLPMEKRIEEFQVRAKKQILVAMKEATQARAFGEIIKQEYKEIENEEARKLYLLTSLVTAHGYSLPKTFFIGAMDIAPNKCLNFLNRDLRGLIIDMNEKFIARHPLIAEHIVSTVEDLQTLKNCYLDILSRLSSLLGLTSNKHDKNFKMYKSLIKHELLIKYFGIEELYFVREIYDSIKEKRKHDFHFWLHYSNLELENDSLDLAKTYISSAKSLLESANQSNDFVELTEIQIDMKKAIYCPESVEANNLYEISCERIKINQENFYLKAKNQMPNTWVQSKLGNICEIIQDGTHFSPKSKSGPCKYITSKNIRFGKLDITSLSYISQEEMSRAI